MGKRKGARLYQPIPLRTAWPLAQTLEEYSGDHGILHEPKYDAFQKFYPNSLNHADWMEIETNLQKEYHAFIEGHIFNEDIWRAFCQKLHRHFELKHDSCEILLAKKALSDALLSDICEDHIPQIGLFVDELIFGPLTQKRIPNPMRQLAGAVCSTLPLLKHGHSAVAKLSTQRPRVSDEIHRSLTAHQRTPFMLWKRTELDGAEPLLPLGKQYTPNSIVKNLPDDPFFIGKIIKLPEHFAVTCGMGISDARLLKKILLPRLKIEWIRYQRYSKITWEDILRERGDILYRTASELYFENKLNIIRFKKGL